MAKRKLKIVLRSKNANDSIEYIRSIVEATSPSDVEVELETVRTLRAIESSLMNILKQ